MLQQLVGQLQLKPSRHRRMAACDCPVAIEDLICENALRRHIPFRSRRFQALSYALASFADACGSNGGHSLLNRGETAHEHHAHETAIQEVQPAGQQRHRLLLFMLAHIHSGCENMMVSVRHGIHMSRDAPISLGVVQALV